MSRRVVRSVDNLYRYSSVDCGGEGHAAGFIGDDFLLLRHAHMGRAFCRSSDVSHLLNPSCLRAELAEEERFGNA